MENQKQAIGIQYAIIGKQPDWSLCPATLHSDGEVTLDDAPYDLDETPQHMEMFTLVLEFFSDESRRDHHYFNQDSMLFAQVVEWKE